MTKKAASNKDIARVSRHLIRLSGNPFLRGIGLHAQAIKKAMEVVGATTYTGHPRIFMRDHFEKLDEYVKANAKLSAKIRKDRVESRRRAPWVAVPDTPENQFVKSDDFLRSFEWRKVRMQALKKYGPKCMCCGATPATGAVMNVDHIKPRKLFPSLALDVNNLQILCHDCNHGKGNWDTTDWRPS
jgi:hypothetical protein